MVKNRENCDPKILNFCHFSGASAFLPFCVHTFEMWCVMLSPPLVSLPPPPPVALRGVSSAAADATAAIVF